MTAIYKRFPTRAGESITGLQFGDQSLNETEYPWRTIAYECLNSYDRPDSFIHQAGRHIFQDEDGNDIAILSSAGIQIVGAGTGEQGTLSWNTDEETLDLICDGAVLQLGQESYMHVRNNTALPMTEGQVIMAIGTLGASGRILVQLMVGSIPANAKYLVGVVTEPIAAGADGKITTYGKVRHLDTSGTPFGEVWADGDVLWVSPVNDGELTNVEPTATQMGMPIAIIIKSHASSGTLFVRLSSLDEHRLLADHAFLPEQAAADTSVAGWGQIWIKATVPNTIYFTNDQGTDKALLTDVVFDTSPQLGGDLDVNGFDFTGVAEFQDLLSATGGLLVDVVVNKTFGVGVNIEGVVINNNSVAATSYGIFGSLGTNNGGLAIGETGATARGIDVGLGRAVSGDSYINLIGDSTYPIYGLRMERLGGASGHSVISHRGTGALIFQVIDDGGWQMVINGNQSFDCWDTGIWMGQQTEIDAGLVIATDLVIGGATASRPLHVVASDQYAALLENDTGFWSFLYMMDAFTTSNTHVGVGVAGDALILHAGAADVLVIEPTYTSLASPLDITGGTLYIKETAAAAADAVSKGQIWVKNTTPNQLWFTDDAGTDVQLGVGGGGGDVVDDLTPELGGDLDALGFRILNLYKLECSSNPIGTEAMLIEQNPLGSASWPALVVESQNAFGDDAKIGLRSNYSAAGSFELGQDHIGTGYLWNITANGYLDFHQNGTLGSMRFYMDGSTLAFRINGDGTTYAAEGAIVGPGTLGTETFLVSQNTVGLTASMAIFESQNALGALARISLENRYDGSSTSLWQDHVGHFTIANLASGSDFFVEQLGAGAIRFKNNSVERMLITSAGLVGINKSVPASPLHVDNTSSGNVMMCEHSSGFWSWLYFVDSITTSSTHAGVGCVGDTLLLKGGAVTNVQIDATTCLINAKVKAEVSVYIKERAAAEFDVAAYGQIWVKTATPNELWFTNDAGTDVQLGTGGGATDSLFLDEQAAAQADVAGDGQYWVRDDAPNVPMFTDDVGTDHNLIGEEGTFTPKLHDVSHGDADGQTYTRQDGSYTLMGDMVFFTLDLVMNSIGSLSGACFVAGLPFTSEATYDWSVYVGYAQSLVHSAETSVTGWIGNGVDYVTMYMWDSSSGMTNMTAAEWSAGGQIKMSGCYRRA